ncbi:4Fe-4S ferredoxin, iron-sulfur binding [Candidatus Karelsulcia muelleri]|uniref:4Fe-4S ferredoxin, iron-sulfur binding n=1 Tax=Candidatus Karelsulcia muelleri TaxID=336810 RepID=A0A654M476_9FLAO|nr:YfhL family 4Fe-4S dicluster ferredoxin [Candidatus Karelsulcia muelleri]AGS33388.1 4Fe-4S ferredoxin, iron-sulfur binding protein [Candidatus Karelsulcia muelleri str. Sulcia-ALF]ALP70128.1 4Fe-4S ferredoxin, iron-sulfur binding [Candidatus Karelsulcia muelleri]QND78374.1 4Fe-4S ferredoxin, iron-sulfur binding [Candidatus Karelsulcia muelleri]
MSLKITEKCINCGACEPECPNNAIYEGTDYYFIVPEKCTECLGFYDEPQCASVCPVDCCILDEENIESEEDLLKKIDSNLNLITTF